MRWRFLPVTPGELEGTGNCGPTKPGPSSGVGGHVASVPDHRAHVTGLYVGFVKRGASVKTLQGLGEKGPLEGEL